MAKPQKNQQTNVLEEALTLPLQQVSSLKWFVGAAKDIHQTLAEAAFTRNVKAGETLFTMGQYDASELIGVVTGEVQITRMSDQSGQMMMSQVGRGGIIGLEYAVARAESRASSLGVVANSDAELVYIEAAAFNDLLVRKPAFARLIMQHLAEDLVGWAAGDHDSVAPAKRVYRLLLELVERDDRGNWSIARMPKHRELSERAGVTENEAADAVADLIRNKFAERHYPGLLVMDYNGLTNLSR